MLSWATRFQLRQHVRQSLWIVPLLGTVAGATLALVDLGLEDTVSLSGSWSYSAATAGSLLAAVVGAMIGLLGLVVTIGVLVVQMATGTLSPRFMRLWYRDRLQKLVLASFTATFAFSFVLLREVRPGNVPDLGVTVAGAAVTADLILLLLYLDRFVHALRPVAVAAAMSRAGLAVLAESDQHLTSTPAMAHAVPTEPPALRVHASRSGAIQAMHGTAIVAYAAEHDLVCVVRRGVGDFVNVGTVLVDVHGSPLPDTERRLRGMVALGHERTIEQDPAFALRIIVDIAIRALSPAVNDPTTAVQMINHLGTLLDGVGTHDLDHRGVLLDGTGRMRLAVPTRSWDSYLDLGLTEIREYGGTSPQVCRRLRALLRELETAVHPANRASVRRQLELLDKTVQTAFLDPDARELASAEDSQGLGGTDSRVTARPASGPG